MLLWGFEQMENDEIKAFVESYKNKPLTEIALLLGKKKNLPKQFILDQVNAWQKSRDKHPEWHSTAGIIFPDKLALEQSSSEVTAKYKAGLVSGETMADLTGGLGMDCYYFSKNFKQSHYIEPNEERYKIAKHNFEKLGAGTINLHHKTAEEFLKDSEKLDFIFLDPDRRNKNKKMVLIEDCSPDLAQIQELVLSKSSQYLVKYSPMLDISLALEKLQFVKQVHVVSVGNECKEILFLAEKDHKQEAEIIAVNLQNDKKESLTFKASFEKAVIADLGGLEKYIYEPNASIRKAGAFKIICKKYGVKKLHNNTHLYTSWNLVEDFPGRVFEVVEEVKPKNIRGRKLNVISKNFPKTAAEIKKKYKIKDGGDEFLIATTLIDSKKVFLWTKKYKLD